MRKLTLTVLPLLLVLVACSPLENQARNTAAALQGTIVAAQAKYQSSCTTNPTQQVCQLINKGISSQNALITSLETYCGWSPLAPPSDPNAKCIAIKSAESLLNVAIANAAQLTLEIKGAI